MGQKTDGAEQGQAHAEGAVAQTHGDVFPQGCGTTLTGGSLWLGPLQWFESWNGSECGSGAVDPSVAQNPGR